MASHLWQEMDTRKELHIIEKYVKLGYLGVIPQVGRSLALAALMPNLVVFRKA